MLRRARTPIRRLVAAGALALTAFGVSVPAASAGHSESISTKQGFVKFDDFGEKFPLGHFAGVKLHVAADIFDADWHFEKIARRSF